MNRFRFPQKTVDQAIKFLKSKKGKAPGFISKFPGVFNLRRGKLYAGKLRVVPTEDREDYLREVVYGKKSEYPFGRDSLFAILKHEVLNVSKRDIESFLNAQGPLVHRRARPKQQKREHLRQIRKPGLLSVDLVHVKAKDFEALFPDKGLDFMGAPGSKGYQQDRYFLNAVDILTGFLLTEVLQGKTARETWTPLLKIIDRYESQFGIKVRQIEVDKGKEFFGDKGDKKKNIPPLSFQKELKNRKEGSIRLVRKVTNAVVEQVNAKMQRIFWALIEQRRGSFLPTVKQAVKISNRTQHRRTGLNPEEAMKKLQRGEKVAQRAPKAGPTERKRAFPVGTKVRALKMPYKKFGLEFKSYKGAHYGAVHPIVKVKFSGVYPKYLVDKKWKWGDEVIRARPTDTKSHQLIIKRPISMTEEKLSLRKGTRRSARIAKQPKKKPKPRKKGYEIGDKVQAYVEGLWYDAEIEAYANKPYDFEVFYRADGSRWKSEVKQSWLRARPR